ncbi:MAG TPA: redoxin domain-containing protein, partial [Thiobacillaceae bacterium]|nr:redoxin domain-containing protein [Thiobacillaceae bacterium]
MITRRSFLLASLASLVSGPLPAHSCAPAPDISGAGPWFNSAPLDLASLRGKVVLVEFWTHGCSNCRNVEPYIKQWQERYAKRGLMIVGVHTPEFADEAEPRRVKDYLLEHRILHPVVMDNDHAIWNRWGNRYWPAVYLVNPAGELCYSHFGEGDYDRTEQKIRA